MKSLNQWYAEYAESHQNPTNQWIHFVCVPSIFFSLVGLLMSIPSSFFTSMGIHSPYLGNWAIPLLIFVWIFYARLSAKTFIKIFIFSILCLIGNVFLSKYFSVFKVSLLIFIVAWIGQFYGHKVEGKKPSFFKDLQYLLIGPGWVFDKWSK
ncbi:MAG TPA: DUF962 domain-containing protein [Saprospiraceae bacterium]|nr:DUF962 domain-containing protein [Saprospiraceae bacterium]